MLKTHIYTLRTVTIYDQPPCHAPPYTSEYCLTYRHDNERQRTRNMSGLKSSEGKQLMW